MGREDGLNIFDRTVEGAWNVIEYPFVHPLKTAKYLALGGLCIAGPAVVMQASHMAAEHGGILPWSQANE
jgi:hypothetical protein